MIPRDIATGREWEHPKELVVTLDGQELLRGFITGYRVEEGEMRCSDPDCIEHHLPTGITRLSFIDADLMEP